MKQLISKLLSVFGGLLLLVALLLTVLDLCCFDLDFFEREYEKYNNAEVIGISDEDLMHTTEVLLDYIQDKRTDMIVKAEIKGVNREVFNKRETDHMVDVKNLYLSAMTVRNFCAVFSLICYGIIGFLQHSKAIFEISKGFLDSCVSFLIILGGLGFYAFVDFTRFWTMFHQIFFTNDLWLLNPKTDIMILMVPEGFFYDLVFKIAFMFLLSATLLFLICLFLKRKEGKS